VNWHASPHASRPFRACPLRCQWWLVSSCLAPFSFFVSPLLLPHASRLHCACRFATERVVPGRRARGATAGRVRRDPTPRRLAEDEPNAAFERLRRCAVCCLASRCAVAFRIDDSNPPDQRRRKQFIPGATGATPQIDLQLGEDAAATHHSLIEMIVIARCYLQCRVAKLESMRGLHL
jgi:hypothetical protein